MGVLIGGIDVVRQTVENEFRIEVLERLLDLLVQRTGSRISIEEIGNARAQAATRLQAKYPDLQLRMVHDQPQ